MSWRRTKMTYRHPKETATCSECANTHWERTDRFQTDPTYECAQCGHEVYVYENFDAGGSGSAQFRPVTTQYLRRRYAEREMGGAGPLNYFQHELPEPLEDLPLGIAIDYWMVEHADWSQSEWAEILGISQPAVSKNVRRAAERLGD